MRLFLLSLIARFSAWLASATEKWRNPTTSPTGNAIVADETAVTTPTEQVVLPAVPAQAAETETAPAPKQPIVEPPKTAEQANHQTKPAPATPEKAKSEAADNQTTAAKPKRPTLQQQVNALIDRANDQEAEINRLKAELERAKQKDADHKPPAQAVAQKSNKEKINQALKKLGARFFFIAIILCLGYAILKREILHPLNTTFLMGIILVAIPRLGDAYAYRGNRSPLAAQIVAGGMSIAIWLLGWRLIDFSGWSLAGAFIAILAINLASLIFCVSILKKGMRWKRAVWWLVGETLVTVFILQNGLKAVFDWLNQPKTAMKTFNTVEEAMVAAVASTPNPLSTAILAVVVITIIALAIRAMFGKKDKKEGK